MHVFRRSAAALAVASLVAAVPAAAHAAPPGVCKPAACGFRGQRAVVNVPSPRMGGYRLVTAAGNTREFGANPHPQARGGKLTSPAVASAATPSHRGTWLVDASGKVTTRGKARSLGSIKAGKLRGRVVAIRAAGDGKGYWLVSSSGQVFAFGSAKRHGALASAPAQDKVIGFDVTPRGKGYWLVTAKGSVYPYGNAPSLGSAQGEKLDGDVVATRATGDGKGLWMVTAHGQILAFGTAKPFPHLKASDRFAALERSYDSQGLWAVTAHGGVIGVGRAHAHGSLKARSAVIGIAGTSKVQANRKATSLRVTLTHMPKGAGSPRVTLRGPGGLHRAVHGTTFVGARPGRYTLRIAPVKAAGGIAYPTNRLTVIKLAAAGRTTVTTGYDQVVSKHTRVASPDAVMSLSDAAKPGAPRRLRIADPGHALAVGSVVAIGVGPETPLGALLKLTSLDRQGDVVEADAIDAALTDIGPQGDIAVHSNLQSAPDAKMASVPTARASDAPFDPTDFGEPFYCSGGVDAKVTGGASIGAGVDMGASWGGFWHPLTVKAHLIVQGSEAATFGLTVTGAATCKLDVDLMKKPKKFDPMEFMLGPVPVVIVPELNFHLAVEGSVSGQLSTYVSQAASTRLGVDWDGDHLHAINDLDKSFYYSKPNTAVQASLRGALGPKLAFMVYGVAGPYLSADVTAKFDLNTEADPWWTIKGGLQAGAGIRADFWGIHFDKGIPDLIGHDWTIAQADGPLPPTFTTDYKLPGARAGTGYQTTLAAKRGRAPYSYALTGGALPAGLQLDSRTGMIAGTPTTFGKSSFTVTVTDQRGQKGTQTFNLDVAAAPLSLRATPLPGATKGTPYSAQPALDGGQPTFAWSLTGSLPDGLLFNSADGSISGTPTTPGTSTFTVSVTDGAGQTASRQYAITTVPGRPHIATTALQDGKVGDAYSFNLSADNGAEPFTWSVTGGALPAGLTLDPHTGAITGTPTAIVDSGSVTVRLHDAAGIDATQTFDVHVVPGDLSLDTTSLTDGTVGAAYDLPLAVHGGRAPYDYAVTSSALPAGLTLDPSTGHITGTPSSISAAIVTLRVRDADGRSQSRAFTMQTRPPVLQATTASLADGTEGSAYSDTLTATGGTGAKSWSVVSGALPAGLTLDGNTGHITGTPTAPANASFTVRVADQNGQRDDQALTIAVAASPTTVSTTALDDAMVNEYYSFAAAAFGGDHAYTWSATGLPQGMVINSTSGRITGKPESAGTASVTITATDGHGLADSKTLSLEIVPDHLRVVPGDPTDATAEAAYTYSVTGQGGTAPYTWSVSDGSLPSGLTLDPATGAISGTPATYGTANFSVLVTDADGDEAGRNLTLVVHPAPLAVRNASPAHGMLNHAYSEDLDGHGGIPPYTYTVSQGALPAGITLDGSTGELSGTPTAIGSTTFTVTLADSQGWTVDRAETLVVDPEPLAVTTMSLADGRDRNAYNQTVAAYGGVAPYSWSATGLPGGLSIDPVTGAITGTPTATGDFTVDVTVTDSQGTPASAHQSLSLHVDTLTAQPSTSVSCPTATFCAVVDGNGGAVRYNGTSWGLRSATGITGNTVVSCATATWCMTANSAGATAIYSGGTWSVGPPMASADEVDALSCPSTTFCVASGSQASGGAAWTYNGTSWAPPIQPAFGDPEWTVSCSSSSFCETTTYVRDTAKWNGSAWSNTGAATQNGVFSRAIGCSAPTACIVVGYGGGSAYWGRWDGTSWAASDNAVASVDAYGSVGCATAQLFCAATSMPGDSHGGGLATYDGTTWTTYAANDSNVSRVACASTSMCVAIDTNGSFLKFDGSSWSAPALADGS